MVKRHILFIGGPLDGRVTSDHDADIIGNRIRYVDPGDLAVTWSNIMAAEPEVVGPLRQRTYVLAWFRCQGVRFRIGWREEEAQPTDDAVMRYLRDHPDKATLLGLR